ncbi:hypothetical protein [Micromonospora inositola]|uniref:hypothetical protein n=1 Tax=Micromonospora inositola TaxID=47865 RepID=UPI0012FE2A78|nr:hypothetical protein [Micromonospora inositola]
MSATAFFGVPTTNRLHHYPELRPLRQAVLSRDWPAVTRFFADFPTDQDPSVAVAMVAELRGVETFLQGAGGGPASSTLAATLLGARWVVMGWEVRTARYASQVSRQQFAQFHDYLARADNLLGDVVMAEPDNVSAWTTRVRIARGLQLGLAEAWRRYNRAAKARPHPVTAQLTLAQQLCPKWGGSFPELHAFAQRCAAEAPPGALNAAVVAEAHIEQARAEPSASRYMRRPEVREQLRQAVARSVGHPAYRPVFGWVQAHSSFAYAWTLAGDRRSAAPHFAALGNRFTSFPWEYYPGSGRLTYKARQLAALMTGGQRAATG